MAGELTMKGALEMVLGNMEQSHTALLTIDAGSADKDTFQWIQSIGTSQTAISATNGFDGLILIESISDNTDFVLITTNGDTTFADPFAKLTPGDFLLMPEYPSLTYRAKANSGSVVLYCTHITI